MGLSAATVIDNQNTAPGNARDVRTPVVGEEPFGVQLSVRARWPRRSIDTAGVGGFNVRLSQARSAAGLVFVAIRQYADLLIDHQSRCSTSSSCGAGVSSARCLSLRRAAVVKRREDRLAVTNEPAVTGGVDPMAGDDDFAEGDSDTDRDGQRSA